MKQLRNCEFTGGPLDSWSGEFVDTGQEMELFGPPADRNYAYRRDHKQSTDKLAVWRYDPFVTEIALKASGVSDDLASAAHAPPASAFTHARPEGTRIEGGMIKLRMDVRHNRSDHRWELWIDGEVHETAPESAIESPDDAKAWLEQLGVCA